MKIAVLGGSFNPPHVCHVFICWYILATSDVDRVWVVPCYKHAFGKELVPFHHRFTMCRLAVNLLRDARVSVSAIEQKRQGTSWTIETARYLHAHFPEHDFTWIIGSDVLGELAQWKGFDELQHLISFLVIPRAGFALSATESLAEILDFHMNASQEFSMENLRIRYPDGPEFQLPNVSSSLIRERIQSNRSIAHLVPKPVGTYICAHNLYKTS